MEMIYLNSTLLLRLVEYIGDEYSDSYYYKELSEKAPTEMQKKMLLEFSEDEKKHAERFSKEVQKITGKPYIHPSIKIPKIPEDYKTALQARVVNEANDFRKYGHEYYAATVPSLKSAFYLAQIDENVHALKILDMLNM